MKTALRVLVAFIALPAVAEAQDAAGVQTLRVPAGLRAFACGAGLPPSLPAARVLPTLARRNTSMPAGTSETLQASQYMAWLGELQSRARAVGSGRDLVFRQGARRDRNAVGDILEWLGFRLVTRDGAFTISEREGPEHLKRQAFAACVGVSSDVLAAALRHQQPTPLWPDDEMAPSPVSASVWLSLPAFAQRDANGLFSALIDDRRALLMYHGFMGLDDETLARVVSDRQLLRTLYEDRAAPFAAFSHALRIRGGAMAVPGGEAQRSRWAALADRDPARAGDFISRLLGRDDGALADFFSTLSALPERTQTAVVASSEFGRLYDVFRSASSQWKMQDNPFSRPELDPGFVLLMLLGDGTPPEAGPGWRRVWEAGFDGRTLNGTDPNLAREFARGDHADLAWLLSAITEDVSALDRRLAMARFARRLFGPHDDAGHAAVTLGGFQHFSVLLLELERAGVRSPATFARVVDRARKLSDTEPQRGAVTMVSWQATVAIVCALATSGAVPEGADALLDELSTLPTGRDGLWDAAMVRFVRDRIVPFTGAPPAPRSARAIEDQLLESLARTRGVTDATFTWEGLEYRTTVTEARAARSKAIARAQTRLPLDDLLALATAAESLRAATTAAQVKAAMAQLDGIEERLPAEIPWLFDTDERPLKPASFIERQLRDARRVTKDGDAGRGRRAADRFVWLADLLTADTLGAVIYAARLGVGLQSPTAVAAVWRRHEFGMRVVAEGKADPDLAWRSPRIGALPDGGWHMRGALIGLDLALGESWLRRLTGGPAPAPTRMADPDQQVLFSSHAFLTISPPAEIATAPPNGSMVAGEPRRERVISWLRQANPRQVAPFAWRDTAKAPAPDWGTAPEDESCLCRPSYLRRPAEAWLGRPLRPTIASLVPDLSLRVAAMAAELGLPPILVPAILAAAQQELLDGAELAFKDDWESLAAFANALSRERFEEYVFALIATRELTPVQKRP